jgi:2-oxoisovalerate dehydrogenase E1 component
MALTVRTQFGAGRSSGSQHSQSLEALLAHIPGLTVVMPSTPADTYGLLRASIQDPNPVVFIENRLLYGMKGPQPPADYVVPIGKSAVVRAGTDVTVVSVSRMVHEAVAAAERWATRDLRRGDRPADGGSARHGADPRLGAQDEPAAHRPRGRRPLRHRRRDRGHRGPRGLLGSRCADRAHRGRRHSAALSPDLERAWLPDRDDIADAIRRLAAV